MVLKYFFLFIFCFTYFLPCWAQQASASKKRLSSAQKTFRQAQQLFDKKKYRQAQELLQESFPLNSPRIPLAILNLSIDSSLKAGDVGYAEKLAYKSLTEKVSWWSKYQNAKDRESIDLTGIFEKANKHHLKLLWLTGESQSILYHDFYEELPDNKKAQLKNSIQAIYEALLQSSFDSEKTEAFFSRINQRDSFEARRPYKFTRSVLMKMISWTDELDYEFQNGQHSVGDAVTYALCLGGKLSYESQIWMFDLSGCFGLGKTTMALNTGYHSEVSARALQAGVGAYRKLSNLRIDIGADVLIFSRYISLGPVATEPEPTSFTDITSFVIAPGIRMNFDHWGFSLKGGKTIGQSSAIWMLEGHYRL